MCPDIYKLCLVINQTADLVTVSARNPVSQSVACVQVIAEDVGAVVLHYGTAPKATQPCRDLPAFPQAATSNHEANDDGLLHETREFWARLQPESLVPLLLLVSLISISISLGMCKVHMCPCVQGAPVCKAPLCARCPCAPVCINIKGSITSSRQPCSGMGSHCMLMQGYLTGYHLGRCLCQHQNVCEAAW